MYKYSLLIIIFSLFFPCISAAESKKDYTEIMLLSDSGAIQPLKVILEELSEHSIRRILEIELEQDNDRYIYEIEYLNDKGMVLEIKVDAVTAEELNATKAHY